MKPIDMGKNTNDMTGDILKFGMDCFKSNFRYRVSKITDRGHCFFLKLTRDIRGPPSWAPYIMALDH